MEYYESGKVKYKYFFKKGNDNEGPFQGKFIQWHENGIKFKEGLYKEGDKDGKWKVWHENGQKAEEGGYIKGNKEGPWNIYYENGKKIEEGKWKLTKEGELHDTYSNGYIAVYRINKDGSITEIAEIRKGGKRKEHPKDNQIYTYKKIK